MELTGKNRAHIKTWNERDYTSLEISTGSFYKIDNATYNLKQLILATNKFRKDDVDIMHPLPKECLAILRGAGVRGVKCLVKC